MSLEHTVNLNSLRIVREELDHTLQRASGEFEAFLVDPGNRQALNQCRQDIAQVGGTLRLLEFPGAALLADEMARSAAVLEELGDPGESHLAALSNAFVVLPRYLEFIAHQQSALPILILPWVNELRAARREAFVPEYHFEQWQAPSPGVLEWPQTPAAGGAGPALKRLRAMYQAGLLAAIRGRSAQQGGALMARAARRVSELFPAELGGGVLPVLAAVTEALAEGGLQLTLNRKRTLAATEQLLGRLQRSGAGALDDAAVAELRTELLFMLVLSGYREGLVASMAAAFDLSPLTPDDVVLSQQRDAMQGPGGDTIDSVVHALRDELRGIKDTLEIGAQNQGLLDDDLEPLLRNLTQIADTLKVINLSSPAEAVRSQLASVERWRNRSGQVPIEEFQGVADAVLFLESCLSALARHQLGAADLNALGEADRDRIIAQSQLAEAQAIVIQEAESGISMAKRAITAYVDSNFDRTHIANVGTTLNTVRGGLAALGYARAAAVVRSCVAFVESHVSKRQSDSVQSQQLLETLADALISLEYYLGEVEASGRDHDAVLQVAEDSLAALGFAVTEPA